MELRTFLEEKKFKRMGLKKLATGHYKMSLKVNGVRGFFIVDTGASNSCVGIEFETLFHLIHEESEVKASGAGSTNMETNISNDNTIEIGQKSYKDITFILFDLSHVNNALSQVGALPVHGIIGADLLKKWRTVIDYGRNCMYLR